MIEVDLCDGLYVEIHMEMHKSLWWQKLDYWKICFYYFIYKQVGHIVKDCTTLEQRNN